MCVHVYMYIYAHTHKSYLFMLISIVGLGFVGGSAIKILLAMQETWIWYLGQEYPLEKEVATHSSILSWEIPWTDELVGYSPWVHKKVGYYLATEQQTTTIYLYLYLGDI